jgi:hypothetical protein
MSPAQVIARVPDFKAETPPNIAIIARESGNRGRQLRILQDDSYCRGIRWVGCPFVTTYREDGVYDAPY